MLKSLWVVLVAAAAVQGPAAQAQAPSDLPPPDAARPAVASPGVASPGVAPARAALPGAAPGAASAAAAPAAGSGAPAGPDAAEPPAEPGVKALSGMSILGNEEAPKSLVIVPWKSSQIGDEVGVENSVDERARPVDKDVFMREVHYYELRSSRAAAPQ